MKKDISSIELQVELKRRHIKQRDLKIMFQVSDGAICRAIKNDPALKSLRLKIIKHLNSLQNKEIKNW